MVSRIFESFKNIVREYIEHMNWLKRKQIILLILSYLPGLAFGFTGKYVFRSVHSLTADNAIKAP